MIFNNAKLIVQAYDDARLLRMLFCALLVELLVLILRTALAPYQLDAHHVCVFASEGYAPLAALTLTIVLIVSKAVAILWAAWLSYQVRLLPQLYNESTYLAMAIYNTLLLCAAWLGVRYGVDLENEPTIPVRETNTVCTPAAPLIQSCVRVDNLLIPTSSSSCACV